LTWTGRFCLWMLVLAPPCWLLSNGYQRLLANVLETLLELSGKRVSVYQLQVYAPFDVVLFTAMCLASTNATRSARWRALLLGPPILVVIELLVVTLAALPAVLFRGGATDSMVPRFTHYTIETIVWVSAPLIWIALLGPGISRSATPELRHPPFADRARWKG